jgi:hypothetical protein
VVRLNFLVAVKGAEEKGKHNKGKTLPMDSVLDLGRDCPYLKLCKDFCNSLNLDRECNCHSILLWRTP